MRKLRVVLALAGVVLAAAAFTAAATADDDDGDGPPGFQTSQEAMLTCPGCRTGGVIPILSVGDQPPNGYTFEAIPDGISLIGGGGAMTMTTMTTTSAAVPATTTMTTTGAASRS